MKATAPALVATLLGLACIPTLASAYSGGPPDGLAGNPPAFENCTICHFSFDVNSGDGSMSLQGLPAEYTPGETYSLSLMLDDPEQKRWGFELTVLDDNDEIAEGGAIVVTDPTNTQISENSEGTEDFLKQTSTGTYSGVPSPVSWNFDWVAPDLPSVTFYFAGNAADGDQSFIEDYIYVQTVQIQKEDATPTVDATWGQIKTLYFEE